MAQHDLVWKILSISIGVFCVLCFAWMFLPERLKPIRFRPHKRWERKTIDRLGRCIVFSTGRSINCAELNQIQELRSVPEGVEIVRIYTPSPEELERIKMLNASGV